jgi:hypothetical protein
VRVLVDHDGSIQVDRKRMMRRVITFWSLEAASPTVRRGKSVFLLRGHDDQGAPALLALRIPTKSRATATLSTMPSRPARSGRPAGRAVDDPSSSDES